MKNIELNTIYNENCLVTMSKIQDKYIDLILTDPPYGINLKYDKYIDTPENWDELIISTLPEMIRIAKMVILPCCRILKLEWFYSNFPPDWVMCWYKGSTGHRAFIGFNDWEPHLVYGKIYPNLKLHDYFQTKSSPISQFKKHPCPKPVDWADYIIKRIVKQKPKNYYREKLIIYDPFCGAGTVPLVTKKYKQNYIGSEISEKYCNVINERLGKFKISKNKKGKGFLF